MMPFCVCLCVPVCAHVFLYVLFCKTCVLSKFLSKMISSTHARAGVRVELGLWVYVGGRYGNCPHTSACACHCVSGHACMQLLHVHSKGLVSVIATAHWAGER